MKINNLILAGGLFLVMFGSCQAPQPNILFIFSDDHAPKTISSYGPSLIKTPNIDRIAEKGVIFRNCFVTNSVCTPSRAVLLSGTYNAVNGVRVFGNNFDGSQTTFQKILQQAGYETAIMGKWHLGSEPTGFDYYNISEYGTYYDPRLKSSEDEWVKGMGGKKTEGYFTDILTDIAINWLKKRKQDKPFCLMVHHKAPHGPYRHPEKYDPVLADVDVPKPKTFHDDFTGKNPWLANNDCGWSKLQYIKPGHFAEPVPEEIELGTLAYKEYAYQHVIKGYHRMVKSLDENIGILLDYLNTSGLDKNTIVIYSSDNGYFLGEHGMFNKQWMYEESIKVPLIMNFPRKNYRGKVIDELVSILDFAPTFLDYAHAEIPPEFQGMSLRPLVENKNKGKWRKSFFYHYYEMFDVPEHWGIRTDRYKLICFPEEEDSYFWKLYDLELDPGEMQNQVNNPVYASVIDSLKVELVNAKNKFESVEPD
jgi:arylsulfatase A-like enzyme